MFGGCSHTCTAPTTTPQCPARSSVDTYKIEIFAPRAIPSAAEPTTGHRVAVFVHIAEAARDRFETDGGEVIFKSFFFPDVSCEPS